MQPTKKAKEVDIQRAILEYLAYRGVFAWRNNTQGRWLPGRNRWIPTAGIKGAPDIIGIISGDVAGMKGQFLGVEVKRPGGKQSPEQAAFQSCCERHGGMYILADSVQAVENALRDH